MWRLDQKKQQTIEKTYYLIFLGKNIDWAIILHGTVILEKANNILKKLVTNKFIMLSRCFFNHTYTVYFLTAVVSCVKLRIIVLKLESINI